MASVKTHVAIDPVTGNPIQLPNGDDATLHGKRSFLFCFFFFFLLF